MVPNDLLNTMQTPSLTTKLQFVNNVSLKCNEVKHNEKIYAYILSIYKCRYVLIYIVYTYIHTILVILFISSSVFLTMPE